MWAFDKSERAPGPICIIIETFHNGTAGTLRTAEWRKNVRKIENIILDLFPIHPTIDFRLLKLIWTGMIYRETREKLR